MPGRGQRKGPGAGDDAGRNDAERRADGERAGSSPGRTRSDAALRSAVLRTAFVNIAVLLAGVGACLVLFDRPVATGYGVGYALGAVNIFWLFRIAGRGLAQPREKVARFVAVRYYLRFIITALVFMALIVRGSVSPVPLLVGLSAAVVTTIAAMIIVAKKEAS